MTISLSKNQTISLAKERPGVCQVFMGLGWDPVSKRNFWGWKTSSPIDLDASAIVFDAKKTMLYSVSFSSLKSPDGALIHRGDNLTGEGEGDDEVIDLNIRKLDPRAAHVVFTVSSFRGQTFDEVENAVARLVDAQTNTEIARFLLSEKGRHTGVFMATLSKGPKGWLMKASGQATLARTVSDMVPEARALL